MAEGIGMKLDYGKIEKDAKASVKPRKKEFWEPPLDALHSATQEVKAGIGAGYDKVKNYLSEEKPPPPPKKVSPTVHTDEKKQIEEHEKYLIEEENRQKAEAEKNK